MHKILSGAVAAMFIATTTGPVSAAQDSNAPAASAPIASLAPAMGEPKQQCELHIWPAERFQAMTSGWLSGLGVVGAVADSAGHASGDQGRKAAIASALDSEGQTKALELLDLTKLLNIKPSALVLHGTPLDRKTVNKILTRRSDSTSPCYAELIVADLFYQKTAIYGRSLKTLFIFRNFGTTTQKPAIYKGWGGNGLKLFPPKEGEDIQAANNELVSVFKADFEEFARNASKSPSVR